SLCDAALGNTRLSLARTSHGIGRILKLNCFEPRVFSKRQVDVCANANVSHGSCYVDGSGDFSYSTKDLRLSCNSISPSDESFEATKLPFPFHRSSEESRSLCQRPGETGRTPATTDSAKLKTRNTSFSWLYRRTKSVFFSSKATTSVPSMLRC